MNPQLPVPVRIGLFLLLGLGAGPGRMEAQKVAWQPPEPVRGDADLSRLGTPVDALLAYGGTNVQGSGKPAADIVLGDATFHSPRKGADGRWGDGAISLVPGAPAQFFNGNLRVAADPAGKGNALPPGDAVTPAYSAVVSNGMFFHAGPVGAVELSGLTPGHYYQIQFWSLFQNDWRNGIEFTDALGNAAVLDAAAGMPKKGPLAPGAPAGQTLRGFFRAEGETASIDWSAGDGTPYPSLCAVALRDVTGQSDVEQAVAAVTAPAPVALRGDVPGFDGADVWKNLVFAKVGRHRLKLDLAVPRDAKRPVPLVVYVHGGGWGGLDKTEGFANGLVRRGFALAAVEYRLSGEAVYPAQIVDCKAAVRWLRVHAAEYGCAGEKIGAIGDSAGGHLVSLLGLLDDPALDAEEGNPGVSSRVQAVADYFGPSDLAALDPHGTKGAIVELLGGPVDQNLEKARRASPLFLVTSSAPPFVIAHGENDKIVPIKQSLDLFQALKDAGVPVQFVAMPNLGHGANTPEAFGAAIALFEQYLR
ncbi:MAG TPA: alpha/beta hydrolase [Candidatus Methylacidiphilales bacterium]